MLYFLDWIIYLYTQYIGIWGFEDIHILRICILRYILYQIIISKIPKFEKFQVGDIERRSLSEPSKYISHAHMSQPGT